MKGVSKNTGFDNDRVFIIAEVSANHGGSLKRAIDMIKEAKRCGADAVKFQAYLPDTITLNIDNKYFKIKHPEWGGQTLYELYKKAYTPWNWFKKLKSVAYNEGIIFFATAFDNKSVDLLEGLNVPFHKIASFELIDLPLIKYMANTKKPIIMSTGMATIPEIREAVSSARRYGAKDVALLKCVSSYPAGPEEMNLATIPDMKKLFKCKIGLSDHSLGIGVPIAAVSLGAKIIEKHFTLSKKIRTPDSFFSIEPLELKALVDNIRIVEKAIGKVDYRLTENSRKSIIFRRSLFIAGDIKKGEVFNESNVKSVRPSFGMRPKYLDKVIGKKARMDIKAGTPLEPKMIS